MDETSWPGLGSFQIHIKPKPQSCCTVFLTQLGCLTANTSNKCAQQTESKKGIRGKEAPGRKCWRLTRSFFSLIPYFKFAPNEQGSNTAQRPQTSESLTAHFRLGKQARVLKFGSPCSGSGFQGNQWLQEPCKTPVLCSCSEHAVLELPPTQTLPGRGFSSISKAPGCNSRRSGCQDTQNTPD